MRPKTIGIVMTTDAHDGATPVDVAPPGVSIYSSESGRIYQYHLAERPTSKKLRP